MPGVDDVEEEVERGWLGRIKMRLVAAAGGGGMDVTVAAQRPELPAMRTLIPNGAESAERTTPFLAIMATPFSPLYCA